MSPERSNEDTTRTRLLEDDDLSPRTPVAAPEAADMERGTSGNTSLVLYESLDGDENDDNSRSRFSSRSYLWPLLIICLPITGAFGSGFQSICVLTPLNLGIWVTLLVKCVDRYDFMLIISAQSIGKFVAYMELLGEDAGSIASMFVVVLVEVVALTMVVATPLKQLPSRFMAFESKWEWLVPVTFTAYYSMAGYVCSTLTNPAYAFADFDSLFQLVSVVGMDGINFVVAAMTAMIVAKAFRPEGAPAGSSGIRFAVLVGLVFGFTGARRIGLYGSFFQTNVVGWEQGDARSVNAVCAVGYHANQEGTVDARLETTRKLAEGHLFLSSSFEPIGADLIVWSELSTSVPSKSEEKRFLQELGKIAVDNQVMLGATYELILSDSESTHSKPKANMFAFILSNGTVALRYQKVHPVFMLESFDTEAGTTAAGSVRTGDRAGTIGAAIGFDFDFPSFVKTAGADVELMLQPASDWNTIGRLHERVAKARAIENGFSLFRCTSGGISGVYSPFGETVFRKVTGTAEGQTAVFATQIPKSSRVFTVYSIVGDGLGLLCALMTCVLLLISVMPHSCIYMAIFSFLSPRYPEKM